MLFCQLRADLQEFRRYEPQPAVFESGDHPPINPRCTPSGLTNTKERSMSCSSQRIFLIQ
jgi:hypothetical protein